MESKKTASKRRASVIKEARRQINDGPTLAQYKGGKPWEKNVHTGRGKQVIAPIDHNEFKKGLLESIAAQNQPGGQQGESTTISKKQVARLVLDTSLLAEASVKMKQACNRATRLVADVEKIHNTEHIARQAFDRYESIATDHDVRIITSKTTETAEEDLRSKRDASDKNNDSVKLNDSSETLPEGQQSTRPDKDTSPDAYDERDEEEDEIYNQEPPDNPFEDVTNMPPGRISYKAMDHLKTVSTNLNSISDSAKLLQRELGMDVPRPQIIKTSLRPRDCRHLLQKIIWLQKTIAQGMP